MAFNAKKIAKVCRPLRIVLGLGLIGYGVYSGNNWFFLGAIPLVAGAIGLCPACAISGQCTITGKDK